MKRSSSVRRILLGGLATGALAATSAADAQTVGRVTESTYLTNEDHIPGAGHYHAPFRAFYPHPYNHYDAQRQLYFYGGTWGPQPHRSIVNISTPGSDAARLAAAALAAQNRPVSGNNYIHRNGFGGTSHSFSTPS